MVDLGWSSYQLDLYEEALSALQNASSLGHDPSTVHYFRGRALLKLERYAEAVASFNEAAAAGNDEIRMWDGRLEAKFLASWYASVQADAEFLCENGHQDRPFVRHWRAISHCIAGKHDEALELFALLDVEPYWPSLTSFFRAASLIGSGAYDEAATVIEENAGSTDEWKLVLKAMLAAAQGLPPPGAVTEMRDRMLSEDATVVALEPAFWLCTALDDLEGAKRCVRAIESQKDARILNVILADLSTVISGIARPWCAKILENALRRFEYPKPPMLSGAEILKQRVIPFGQADPEHGRKWAALLDKPGVSAEEKRKALIDPNYFKKPKTKTLFQNGMECRLHSIESLDEEHALAKELMETHATAKRAIVMIRLGKTRYMFILCNFKFSEVDSYDLKHSGPLDLYISYRGTCPLRDQILDPYKVRQVICNDRGFIAGMKKGVKTRLPAEYVYVNRLPKFEGREVIYE